MSKTEQLTLSEIEERVMQHHSLVIAHYTVYGSNHHKVTTVKNLGWLLRHWREVTGFTVKSRPDGRTVLFACMNGRQFETMWEDSGILRLWLDRPVFKGLYCHWFGVTKTIGDKGWYAE